MLSSESAMGQLPVKALTVLKSVNFRIERWLREENCNDATELESSMPMSSAEEQCNVATKLVWRLSYYVAGLTAPFLRWRPVLPCRSVWIGVCVNIVSNLNGTRGMVKTGNRIVSVSPTYRSLFKSPKSNEYAHHSGFLLYFDFLPFLPDSAGHLLGRKNLDI